MALKSGTDPQEFILTYSTWPIDHVYSESHLSSLCVFADKTMLPYPYLLDPDALEVLTFSKQFASPDEHTTIDDPSHPYRQRQRSHQTWRKTAEPLFANGILEFASPPIESLSDRDDILRLIQTHVSLSGGERAFYASDMLSGTLTTALHVAFASKPHPELFFTGRNHLSTGELSAYLATSLFNIAFPRLKDLEPEQILELREIVSDTREGFRDKLFALSDDIESRLHDGTTLKRIAADQTIQRRLLPDYHEYVRQLRAHRSGLWARVVDAGAQVIQIDASILSPKFYAEFARAILSIATSLESQTKDAQSIDNQAFTFLSRTQRHIDKIDSG